MSARKMVKLTIGVPLFNSERLIKQCLENLLDQSCSDFRIHIFDNDSTDNTEAICQDFETRYSCINYTRNETNIGQIDNFLAVLNNADTEYFMWHADDDLLSHNFVERLVLSLDRHCDAKLAVGAVVTRRLSKGTDQVYPFPRNFPVPRCVNKTNMLLRSRASWFYGIWRTDYLKKRFNYITKTYPGLVGFDHLLLSLPILDGEVAGDNEARFIQVRDVQRAGSGSQSTAPIDISEMIKQKLANRQLFRQAFAAEFSNSKLAGFDRIWISLFGKIYADRCSQSGFRKLLHLRSSILMKHLMGRA